MIGDRLLVAEPGTLNTQFFGLSVDVLSGGALIVYLLVCVAVPIELVPDASADAGGYFGDAATIGPLWVIDGAILAGGLGKKQGTNIAPTALQSFLAHFGAIVSSASDFLVTGSAHDNSFTSSRNHKLNPLRFLAPAFPSFAQVFEFVDMMCF